MYEGKAKAVVTYLKQEITGRYQFSRNFDVILLLDLARFIFPDNRDPPMKLMADGDKTI